MPTPILATKLYIPAPRPKLVLRPRLIERLNQGLHHKLTLISAPAGFGKTTLVSEWIVDCEYPVAWLALDEGDNDPTRFLAYLISAIQTINPHIGEGMLNALQSTQSPPIESVLTALVNEIASIPDNFLLVLDDYHIVDSTLVDNALTFLLEHLPPQLHLVITTREDPPLPLARLRVRDQLTELRATDLRFTADETTDFLNQVMTLNLSIEDVTALESRTEGWIAGLQLAAVSMQGHQDATQFIKSFTGSHHFVLDYLVEEVLHQQSASVQDFLLQTAILDRLSGSLCDALLGNLSTSGQEILEYIEQTNLFIVPLDNERRWYRYHHLFADLLRQRLQQSTSADEVAELHIRASIWHEENGLEIEAFHHAVAAQDIERAERLIEGNGMPLHFRGGVMPVLNWLNSLPSTVLDRYPRLWTAYASVLLVTGQVNSVESTLQSAELAIEKVEPDDNTQDILGRIAAIRATLAASLKQVEDIITQSNRALKYLHPDNLAFRTSTIWKLGYAYDLQGNRDAARQAYTEVISIGQASGNAIFVIMALIGLGNLHERDNEIEVAAQTYRQVLDLLGNQPLPVASAVYLGLARIAYEWNDLDAAHEYVQQSIQLTQVLENNDSFVVCKIFMAHLKLAQGDLDGATTIFTEAEKLIRQYKFDSQLPKLVDAQVLTLIQQDKLSQAAELAQTYDLPLSQARVYIAQEEPAAALAVLEEYRQQAEAKDWADEQLKVMILQAVALYAHNETEDALQVLGDALGLGVSSGFIRIFIDEGLPMMQLLAEAKNYGMSADYINKLLAVFEAEQQTTGDNSYMPANQVLIEPLSERELEILQLIADGLSNREISERLFLALSTIKGHNRNIFDKLQVQRRTEAVAYARELGLL